MSKESYYFPHDYNARADRKMVNLNMSYGMMGVGVYWCLVEMLYEEGGYLPIEYERISFELREDTDVIRHIINDFDLFKTDDEKFWSESVLVRLNQRCEKSEKARKSINKRWEKIKDTNVLPSNPSRNTRKERKGKNILYPETFLSFWKAYPKKSGSKSKAFTNWQKLNGQLPSIEIILDAVQRQIVWRENANGEFRPEWKDPERWIKDKMWEAETVTTITKATSW